MSNNVVRKSCRLWDNVEKYSTARQATYDIRRMRIAYSIPKAKNTHSKYVILIILHGNDSYANTPQYYVTRTLRVVLLIVLFTVLN
jgi:hypothetical protein